MSFKTNDCQQLTFSDSFSGLTSRKQKALEKSWAKVFADEVFPEIEGILKDADILLERCGSSYDEVTEYLLLVRRLSEHTVVEEAKRRLKTKEDGDTDSKILQNSSNPDATYRDKARKKHHGYATNLKETVGENGTIVTDYQYD